MRRTMVLAVVMASAASAGVVRAVGPTADDAKGSHDHPLLPRFADSVILKFTEKAFDAQDVVVEPIQQDGGRGSLHAEGKITLIYYRAPADASIVQVLRNYETALQAAGFETLYRCSGKECGSSNGFTAAITPYGDLRDHGTMVPLERDNQQYIAAKLSRDGGNVYVMLYINDCSVMGPAPYVILRVIEERPMKQTMVKVNASEMAQGIAKSGRVALYGIYFDSDKADVKPESKATLDEIAKLLREDPGLKLYVVGHTDNQGTAEYNLDLSRRRAQAVVAALTSQYGVEVSRLTPYGVGLYSPVASNESEQGRAQNRRVELVKR